MKANWYKRKDGTTVMKVGKWKVLEISKRPHGKYCCLVFSSGYCIASEGYHGTFLKTLKMAKDWGISKAKEKNIIE